MTNYLDQRRKFIEAGRPLPEKKKYVIPKVSKKRAAKLEEQKKKSSDDQETEKQRWFTRRRAEMTGTCQCGCGMPSSKYDDKNYRSSICHIFPQRLFKSIQFHHLNWVERKFWADPSVSACHANMDNRSMDLWPNMADWDDIKEKFHILAQELTDQERVTKFFNHLQKLVYEN